MASGSSGRGGNSGSKGFDFRSDDILCSYEDYGNQDGNNGAHSDSSIGANPNKLISLLEPFLEADEEMARRSKHSLDFTPNYAMIGEPSCFSLKLYYGGFMKHCPTKEYLGGLVEFFDFADIDKIDMLDLWGYANELGYTEKGSLRFWHKYGKTMRRGRYIEKDEHVTGMKKHMPKNFEIEMYVEHLDAVETNVENNDEYVVGQTQDENNDENNNGNTDLGMDDNHVVSDDVNIAEFDNSGDDNDYEEEFFDSDYDLEADDVLFDKNVDHDVEFSGVRSLGVNSVTNDMYSMMQNEEGDEDCVNSDEDFHSIGGSDEENIGVKYPKFNPKVDNKNPELKLGLIFSTKAEAKFAIESHCYRRGMMMKFEKNDKHRLRAVCKKENCTWCVLVSPMQNDYSWQIKTYNSNHNNCSWSYNNCSLRSGWIGKTFVKKFKENPKLGTTAFRNEICSTLKSNISKSQAYRARRKSLTIIEGKVEEQFSKIWNYCEEITRTNPGSTVRVKVTDEEDGSVPTFMRLYLCFAACKDGFKAGCRPLVGVDGCFLKGKSGGQLLSAVGLDPNNNIFPIAYAIVETENKDSWLWFLNLLASDLGIENQYNWTFMSDKQKGLIPAFEDLLPNADNRFCVRHLHSNMKRDGFNGIAIKNALWAAARATRVEEFNRKMEALKEIDEAAFLWLVKKPPHQWSRSHFTPYSRCDILLNNMCECFNSFILDARDKPIISMLETIRNLLMARMQTNREKALKWQSSTCPKIRDVLHKNMKEASEYIPMKSDEWNYQITGIYEQHTVDVLRRTCSCRRWDLNGIPCKHAVSAIWCRNEQPEDYIHNCYKVETYKKCYEKAILPMNGSDLWPQSTLVPPLPPTYKVQVGRPKKIRRREPDEPPAASQSKLRVVQRVNRCRKCGEKGHNSRGCKKQATSQTTLRDEDIQVETEADHMDTQAEHMETQVKQGHEGCSAFVRAEASQPSVIQTQESISTRFLQKLKVRKPKNKGLHIGGSSNRLASVNINQSTTISAPLIVKGGKNFITMNNLKVAAKSANDASKAGAPGSVGALKSTSNAGAKDGASVSASVGASVSATVGGLRSTSKAGSKDGASVGALKSTSKAGSSTSIGALKFTPTSKTTTSK